MQYILVWISLNFVSERPIFSWTLLVGSVVWHRAGDKPLPDKIKIQFTDTYGLSDLEILCLFNI